jgi:adenylosuccinate lyase
MDQTTYVNPLVERFATPQMVAIFSPQKKFSTWRRVWLALAEAQSELGLDITAEQLDEMRRNLDNIDFETAKAKEREIRHDVMAHVYAFGLQCPKAKPIIHLGATSEFLNGNTDLLLMREALILIRGLLVNVLERIMKFADKHSDLPTLGLTHFQPAQPVTLGKRAVLWAQDLLFDLDGMERLLAEMKCRGAKGTTGTQASYLHLFDGDHDKVKRLDRLVAQKLGFSRTFPVTGQTYPRKVDTHVVTVLAGIGESAHKFATDMRLLQGFKEVEEPFGEQQTGSSAMAYKRNPMRCERLCSLARHLMLAPVHAAFTSATQWFERTLDDSAIRRIYIPEAFMTSDAVLNLYLNVMENPEVYPKMMAKRLEAELPFMATETILMECVKRGADRQKLHGVIRDHAMSAAKRVKQEGKDNDLIERLASDPEIPLGRGEIELLLDLRKFVGRAPEQVAEFIKEQIRPVMEKYTDLLGGKSDVRV